MKKSLKEKIENQVKNGIFFPDFKTSELERSLFNEFEEKLRKKDFKYLSIPSLIKKETIVMQGVVPWDVIFKINNDYGLSGSAEQGILECFTGKNINDTLKVYAKNQCFRFEKEFNGLKYLKEFIKLEQFVFCRKAQKDYYFEQLLNNSVEFLKYHNIKHRIVDVTQRDKGYHIKKYDIEVYTMTYDWMETHSCSYFGTNQTKRFGISGVTHTISNTGIASPRILIPFLEREL